MSEADKTAFRVKIKTLAFSWQAKRLDRDAYREELDKIIEEIYDKGFEVGLNCIEINTEEK